MLAVTWCSHVATSQDLFLGHRATGRNLSLLRWSQDLLFLLFFFLAVRFCSWFCVAAETIVGSHLHGLNILLFFVDGSGSWAFSLSDFPVIGEGLVAGFMVSKPSWSRQISANPNHTLAPKEDAEFVRVEYP